MGGSSSTSADTTKTSYLRYAPYVESFHSELLNQGYNIGLSLLDNSPYVDISLDNTVSFFGLGNSILNFHSVFNTFDSYLLSVDLKLVWNYIDRTILEESKISELINNQIVIINEKYDSILSSVKNVLRDLNVVNTSTYVIELFKHDCDRTIEIAEASKSLRYGVIPEVVVGATRYLNYNVDLVRKYAKYLKGYFITSMQVDNFNLTRRANDKLWKQKVVAYNGRYLGTLQNTPINTVDERGIRKRSLTSKIFLVASWTVNGAMIGGEIGGGWGAAIGGVIGLVIGIAIVLLE